MSDQIMITVLGVTDHLTLKAMEVLNQTFFENATLTTEITEGTNLTFTFEEIETKTEFTIVGTLGKRRQQLKRTFEINREKTRKYAILGAYSLLLQQHTKQKQSWGLLNGMRPTKLIHVLKKRGVIDEAIKSYMQEEYLVADEKIDLLLDVANHQLRVVPDLYELQKEVSLYIGIPFCPTRCAYCTFAAYAYEPFKKWVEPFLETLLKEVQLIGAYLRQNHIKVTSIYYGGGTATTLSASQLEKLITTVEEAVAHCSSAREITVEAGRPDTITPEKLQVLTSHKIERISINPQSFQQKTLDRIGRHHAATDVIDKFRLAKEFGISNINMDLIIGLPGENQKDIAKTLEEVKKLQPESLTVHMLAYKRKSELTQQRGLFTTATKSELQAMGQLTYEYAALEGYVPYYLYRQKNISGNMENIGYSKVGHESIYNIVMMEEAQNVLGLGVGASSKYLIGTSVHNPKDIKTYIENYETYVQKKLQTLSESLSDGVEAFIKNDI